MHRVTVLLIRPELAFSTARSGGPGGQNVNKVETKVTVRFDVGNSKILTPEEKEQIGQRLASRINSDGVLVATAQESRSQLENRERALQKLDALLASAFRKKKARKRTKATASSRKKRLQSKKVHGEKKKWRQRPTES